MSIRITERSLVLPALYVMTFEQNGSISTTDLISKLRDLLNPVGEDLEILLGRNDDKFSQKVRNLKAHDTLTKPGYAIYTKGDSRSGIFTITNNGKQYLNKNLDVLKYLLSSNFQYLDTLTTLEEIETHNNNRQLESFDEFVAEGTSENMSSSRYRRSYKLRSYALEYYQSNGTINCDCCTFDFSKFYGDIGKGFIELHHIKPIYKYEDEDLNKTLEEAVKNITPLCPNCHRMIHSKRNKLLTVKKLRDLIQTHGFFFENLKKYQ